MTTTTLNAHVDVALYLKDKLVSGYVGLGKTSPWVNEDNPPKPEKDKEVLDELIGLKKPKTVSICRPLREGETTNNPTVQYLGKDWVLVSDDEAKKEEAYYVYVEAEINPRDFPEGTYRQVGVYSNVNESKTVLSAEEAEGKGLLEFYENRPPYNRKGNVKIVERFIVEC